MILKTFFIFKVLQFVLTHIQTTDCLFVSIGDYPNHIKYGVNLPECGLRYIPRNVTRHHKCFKNNPGNATITMPSKAKVDIANPRVFNGRDAAVGESPWTIRLDVYYLYDRNSTRRGKMRCTGSLITFQWILTAAHCFNKVLLDAVDVLAGSQNWVNSVNMRRVFKHPFYHKAPNNSMKYSHDIALVKLIRKYKKARDQYSYLLNTICLPNESQLNENEENATFSGWGWIDIRRTFPERLQIYEPELKESRLCDPGMLCAHEFRNDPRTCKGDSGGPLFQFSDEVVPKALQIGVLQGGEGPCEPGNGTSIWNPPMRFLNWILDMIERISFY